jgi:RNA polymerase subunit RPABC4/transcription elongation factor Spt4
MAKVGVRCEPVERHAAAWRFHCTCTALASSRVEKSQAVPCRAFSSRAYVVRSLPPTTMQTIQCTHCRHTFPSTERTCPKCGLQKPSGDSSAWTTIAAVGASVLALAVTGWMSSAFKHQDDALLAGKAEAGNAATASVPQAAQTTAKNTAQPQLASRGTLLFGKN